ncbi:DUF1310 family protein [Alloscardovia theropitheci]|uniref:DUF1310 family protein n=1 Tax=Alloscardovia theropitheci TaxID=2496842 RepID=A0A4R0QQT3_9BIFI|nr:DUF1310 family protein [Alloscardovia theropitheci]TCD54692.1 DUF1310 family protein [Alloscardovia theropitheci]
MNNKSGMKKFIHTHRVAVIIVSIIAILIGVIMVPPMIDQAYMHSVVTGDEGNQLITNMLKETDPHAFTKDGTITSYRILTDTIKHNPMGGIMVSIELNNDPDLNAGLAFERNNSEQKLTVRITDLSTKMYRLYKRLGVYEDNESNE